MSATGTPTERAEQRAKSISRSQRSVADLEQAIAEANAVTAEMRRELDNLSLDPPAN
jgi:hypothetical protein